MVGHKNRIDPNKCPEFFLSTLGLQYLVYGEFIKTDYNSLRVLLTTYAGKCTHKALKTREML